MAMLQPTPDSSAGAVRCPHCHGELPPTKLPLVASRSRPKFHYADCEFAEYIRLRNDYLEFGDRDEARDAGLKPCRTCCP